LGFLSLANEIWPRTQRSQSPISGLHCVHVGDWSVVTGVPRMPGAPTVYKAFISYSHAADSALAPELQSALERFGKPWYRIRAIRVFRDTTDLSVTPELWPVIEKALGESEYLLFLASPQAARSKWVKKELTYWRQFKDCSRLLILLTDGRVVWDDAAGDYDWSQTNALPDVLRGAFHYEPLYLDFCGFKSGQLTLDDQRFLENVASVAAPLHGVSKADIYGEHIRQHRRTMRLAWGAIFILSVLLFSSVIAAYTAIDQWREARTANKNLHDSNRRLDRSLQETKYQLSAQEGASARTLALIPGRETDALRLAITAAEQSIPEKQPPPVQVLEGLIAAVSRRLSVAPLVGHRGPVLAAAYSPDGSIFVTAGFDGRAILWDTSSQRAVGHLGTRKGPIWAIDISPDSQYLLTADQTGAATVWEMETGEEVQSVQHGAPLAGARFAVRGTRIVTYGANYARVWNATTGTPISSFRGHQRRINALAISPSGLDAVTVADDQTPCVWRLEDGSLRFKLIGHEDLSVNTAAYSAKGDRILTTGLDRTARVWDAQTGALQRTFTIDGMGPGAAAFSPNGELAAVGSLTGDVNVWEIESKQVRARISGRGVAPVKMLTFSPDSRLLVKIDFGNDAECWEMSSGFFVRNFEGHTSIIWSAKFSPDGQLLGTASDDGTGRLWRIREDNSVRSLRASQTPLDKLSCSSDGKLIATAGRDGRAMLYRVPSGKFFKTIERFPASDGSAAAPNAWLQFSPKGTAFIAAQRDGKGVFYGDIQVDTPKVLEVVGTNITAARFSYDGTHLITVTDNKAVQVWSIDQLQIHTSIAFDEPVNCALLSWDNSQLITGHDTYVARSDVALGKTIERVTSFTAPVVSADIAKVGGQVAVAWANRVGIWDLATRKVSQLAGHQRNVFGVSFSPDGAHLVSYGLDKTARIWKSDGDAVATLKDHTERVTSVAFVKEGSLVITGSWDGTARLWETASGRLIGTFVGSKDPTNRLEGFDAAIQEVGVSGDGESVITANGKGEVRIYLVDLAKCFAWAKELLPVPNE